MLSESYEVRARVCEERNRSVDDVKPPLGGGGPARVRFVQQGDESGMNPHPVHPTARVRVLRSPRGPGPTPVSVSDSSFLQPGIIGVLLTSALIPQTLSPSGCQ